MNVSNGEPLKGLRKSGGGGEEFQSPRFNVTRDGTEQSEPGDKLGPGRSNPNPAGVGEGKGQGGRQCMNPTGARDAGSTRTSIRRDVEA